jgi:hypothetical protein
MNFPAIFSAEIIDEERYPSVQVIERLAKIITIPQTKEQLFYALLETTGERLMQCAYMHGQTHV